MTRTLAFALSVIFCAPSARAHLPVTTNIAVDIEVVDNLLVIEPWIPTFMLPPLQDITFANQDAWPNPESRTEQLEAYIDEVCPIEIDGVRVKPKLHKLGLQPMEQAKHLDAIIDFVEARIVLHYQTESPPEKIKFRWGIYVDKPEGGWGALVDPDQDPQEFDLMMFVDRKEDFLYFSPDEPEFLWHRKPAVVAPLNIAASAVGAPGSAADGTTAPATPSPRFPLGAVIAAAVGVAFFLGSQLVGFKLPVRVAGLAVAGIAAFLLSGPGAQPTAPAAGSGGITPAEADATFRQLQANLYSAFDFDTEDQVYDVLAQSVDGELLDDIYTEVYRSLIIVDKSSAVCKVHQVEVLESEAKAIDPLPDGRADRFEIACHWRIHGLVQHHAHIHRRVNEYRANYQLALKAEGWRITGVAVSQQDRLDPKTLQKSADF